MIYSDTSTLTLPCLRLHFFSKFSLLILLIHSISSQAQWFGNLCLNMKITLLRQFFRVLALILRVMLTFRSSSKYLGMAVMASHLMQSVNRIFVLSSSAYSSVVSSMVQSYSSSRNLIDSVINFLLWRFYQPDPYSLVVMTSWSLSELYNRNGRKLLVKFLCIKYIYLSRSIYVNNNYILHPLSLMIITHMSTYISLPAIIIIFKIQYASFIIIIGVHLFIFQDILWIVLGSNTINEKLIPFCAATTLLPPISTKWLLPYFCGSPLLMK